MAFRLDLPEQRRRPRIPFRRVARWLLIAVTGSLLGASCYLLTVPTGAVRDLVEGVERSDLSEQALNASGEASAEAAPSEAAFVPVTGCEAPLSPEQSLREFFGRLNEREMEQAWEMMAPGLQSRLYGGDFASFQTYWMEQGHIEVGLVTTMQPSETSAILLAQLLYVEGSIPAEFEAELYYDAQQCIWLMGTAQETR